MSDGQDCVQGCSPYSTNARKAAKTMSCAELLAKILELTSTEKVGRMGTKGLVQRFRDYLGDDLTHGPQLLDQQRSLRTYMEEYTARGCGDPPVEARAVVNRPLPAPRALPAQDGTSKALRTGAVLGGGAVLGYGVYRVLRMLPSLLPPLWPTIPANLAIP